jgi:hypothetical protein
VRLDRRDAGADGGYGRPDMRRAQTMRAMDLDGSEEEMAQAPSQAYHLRS